MNEIVGRVQVEVSAARGWRRLGRLRIGVDDEFIFTGRHCKAIASHVRIRSGEPLIEKAQLHERVKVRI